MAIRAQKPETVTLGLSDGEWLLVKKRLTAGESRDMFARMLREGAERDVLDTPKVGIAQVLTYLIDWSATTVAEIKDQPLDVVQAVLDSLETDSFREIQTAVEKHVAEMDKERAREKKVPVEETASPAILQSVAG